MPTILPKMRRCNTNYTNPEKMKEIVHGLSNTNMNRNIKYLSKLKKHAEKRKSFLDQAMKYKLESEEVIHRRREEWWDACTTIIDIDLLVRNMSATREKADRVLEKEKEIKSKSMSGWVVSAMSTAMALFTINVMETVDNVSFVLQLSFAAFFTAAVMTLIDIRNIQKEASKKFSKEISNLVWKQSVLGEENQ